MRGRMIPYLLAGLTIVFAPTLLDGQQLGSPTVLHRPKLKSLAPRIASRPIREPSMSIPAFDASGGASPEFSRLVRAAGTIFSGTVTRVQRNQAGSGQSVTTVAITFHVENVLRGKTPRRELTIHEWSGLWASGQRYRVGEHVLLFLYPESKLGLTSPVQGALGRFAMDASGSVLLAPQHMSALRRHPALGGKSRLRFSDFAVAVNQAGEGE